MNNDARKVLHLTGKHDLHVHEIDKENPIPNYPLAFQDHATHFIMRDDKILYVGSCDGVINFVLSNFSLEGEA